jgi:hypothetical protein
MLWSILFVIVGFIIIRFLLDLNKDNDDFNGQSFEQKFSVVVETLNKATYNGRGVTTVASKREFNLYEEGQNQIIHFYYSTGSLVIIWKYKYFQKEVVHEKQFSNVRNLSTFEQQKIAESMINEMSMIIQKHINSV